MTNELKTIITYGTLRKGCQSHASYLNKKYAKFLGEGEIKGFDLYNLSGYPAIVEGEGKVKVEMYELPEKFFNRIAKMEKCARYKSKEIIVNNIKGTIWFFDKQTLEQYKRATKIEHGDYYRFVLEKKIKSLNDAIDYYKKEVIKIENDLKKLKGGLQNEN